MIQRSNRWHGYADAKPSEAIQRHALPCLSVAVIFPYKENAEFLDVPVKQYKTYNEKNKQKQAKKLTTWLDANREQGLFQVGFVNVHTQHDIAKLGLELIEELPDCAVIEHYDGYRLIFENEGIDFSQAVSLLYYYFTITFGVLRAGLSLPIDSRSLLVAMDRFPGASTGLVEPGKPVPITQGAKFIEFVSNKSVTGRGLLDDNKKIGLDVQLTTLDWWRRSSAGNWLSGKRHPHFILPDWLNVASIANEFPVEFATEFKQRDRGEKAILAFQELYRAFKKFDIWSMEANVLGHIRASQKLWSVPADASKFIMDRALAR